METKELQVVLSNGVVSDSAVSYAHETGEMGNGLPGDLPLAAGVPVIVDFGDGSRCRGVFGQVIAQ
jgi:hypothetical protein